MAKSVKTATSFQPRPAPDFSLPSSDGTTVSRDSLKGRWSVLFIYPADNTPACTKEACDFSAAAAKFKSLGVNLLGLSKDSLADHDKFVAKYGLKMPLLSDESIETIAAFGSWGLKVLYGREYMGTDRSTFLIDPEGMIRHEWRKVRTPGHVEKVLEQLQALMAN